MIERKTRIAAIAVLIAGSVTVIFCLPDGTRPRDNASPADTPAGEKLSQSSDAELHRAPMIKKTPSATGGDLQAADSKETFKAYGRVSPQTEAEVYRELDSSMQDKIRQLDRLTASYDPGDTINLEEEALLMLATEWRRVQKEMLLDGEYITLDPEVRNRIWPSTPEGKTIITYLSGKLDGKAVDMVFVIDHEKYPQIARLTQARAEARNFQATEVAHKFNQLPYGERERRIEFYRKVRAGTATATSMEEKWIVYRIKKVRAEGGRISEVGYLLVMK